MDASSLLSSDLLTNLIGLIQNADSSAGANQPPSAAGLFNRADANGDGSLSQAELAAMKGHHHHHHGGGASPMQAADANGDGVFSSEEPATALKSTQTSAQTTLDGQTADILAKLSKFIDQISAQSATGSTANIAA